MDINDQLTTIVNSIMVEVQKRVNDDIDNIMLKHVESAVEKFDFAPIVDIFAKESVQAIVDQIEIPTIDVEGIENQLLEHANTVMANITQNTQTVVQEAVIKTMEEAQIGEFLHQELTRRISLELSQQTFLPNSIKASAINWEGHRLSGDHVFGGIIADFSSVGIDDKASTCQLTIMDNIIVCEQPILTTGLEVKGKTFLDSTITNSLEVKNEFTGNAISKLGDKISHQVKSIITRDGLNTHEIKHGENILLNTSELGTSILKSSLRKVGTLDGLETSGETNLSETLYAYRKRVGINTIEPGHTFTIWDGETEFIVEKRSQNRVFVGTHRPQSLTISSNGKDNLSVDPDGSVTINDLKLGAVTISTSSQTPDWKGHTGELVFNDTPKVGQPSFWCCLGGNRWAIGAIISE